MIRRTVLLLLLVLLDNIADLTMAFSASVQHRHPLSAIVTQPLVASRNVAAMPRTMTIRWMADPTPESESNSSSNSDNAPPSQPPLGAPLPSNKMIQSKEETSSKFSFGW